MHPGHTATMTRNSSQGRIAANHRHVHPSLSPSEIADASFALHGTPRTYPALQRFSHTPGRELVAYALHQA
ncbi:hypothetical protein HaLaN_23620, partial [Haematococcus lacustris]